MSVRTTFHPHPITDRAYWDDIAIDPAFKELRESIEATDFLAARRLLLGIDPIDQDDTLLNWLWVMTTQPTWAVVAHLPGKDLPSTTPSLDLAACEMAADLAEMVETLGPWMDSISGTLRERVIDEVEHRIIAPYSNPASGFWWEEGLSNWAGMCAGSILAACESLAAIGRPHPIARTRAIGVLRKYLQDGFTEHGECDQGIGYWSYGLAFAMAGLSRLSNAEYEAVVDRERLRTIANYPHRAHLFGGTFYAGNDGDAVNPAVPWLCEILAASEGIEWLREWASAVPAAADWSFSQLLRNLSIRATPPKLGPESVSASSYLPDQQVAILRTPRVIAILEGGHNDERHNHNDIGSVRIFVDNTAIVPDLGNRTYTADYFSDKRYTYLATSSLGHNCPIVNGHAQRPSREAIATVHHLDLDNSVFTIEASAAYPPEAGLTQWFRTLRLTDSSITLSDEFTATPNSHVTVRVWSTQPIVSTASGDLDLGAIA